MSDHHHHVSFKDLPTGGEKFEPAKASKLIGILGLLGALGLAASGYFMFAADEATKSAFAYSWLFAIFAAFTLVAGGCFWILLHNASNSSWGVVIRRLFENLAMLSIPLFVLAIPLLFTNVNKNLYEWMNHHRAAKDVVEKHAGHGEVHAGEGHDAGSPVKHQLHEMAESDPHMHILVSKYAYLNLDQPFGFATFSSWGSWYSRFFAYFLVLIVIAWLLRSKFIKQEADGAIKHTINARQWSSVLLFPFALTITFAAIDWIMGLDYTWFSTMWGVYIFAGCAWSSMALMFLIVSYLRSIGYLQKVVTTEHYHLMGKLMFAFTVFWAYIAFSQYFLIWYANIPEETRFYFVRNTDGWRFVSIFIVIGHFIVPFLGLLSQPRKKNTVAICVIASWVLLMHIVDLYWMIVPERGPSLGVGVLVKDAWMGDIVAFIGVVGTLGYLYFRLLGTQSLYAWRDPRLIESINVKN